jgi:hypothetical protein
MERHRVGESPGVNASSAAEESGVRVIRLARSVDDVILHSTPGSCCATSANAIHGRGIMPQMGRIN